MIRYTRVDGLSLGADSGLPAINISQDGQRIGSIPGWNTLLTPDSKQGNEPRNRVVGGQYLTAAFSNPLSAGEFPNGALSFDRNNTNRFTGLTNINKSAWTFFIVVHQRTIATAGIDFLQGILAESTPGLRSPRLALNNDATDFALYEEAGTTNAVARLELTSFVGRTALLMATYSDGNGVNLYENGAVGASNPSAESFEELDRSGQYYWLNGFTVDRAADVGHAGLLDIDMSRPENAGHRRVLENYMFELYGIDA